MGMSREERGFPPGGLVLVKRGRHLGSVFAVIGTERHLGVNMILIADGRRVSARKPKRKNPRHVEDMGVVSGEMAARLAGEKFIDDGWLCEAISRLACEISHLILEEVG